MLRVTSTGYSGAMQTQVVNAETGEPVRGVQSVALVHDDVGDIPRLHLVVTDFELDALVQFQGTAVAVGPAPPPEPTPRLLLLARRRIPPAAIENLRHALQALSHEARPVVIDDGVDVYQLVDGRWVPVDPRLAPAPPDVLARDGITADGGPPCPDASPASSSCPSGSPSASPTAPPASSGS